LVLNLPKGYVIFFKLSNPQSTTFYYILLLWPCSWKGLSWSYCSSRYRCGYQTFSCWLFWPTRLKFYIFWTIWKLLWCKPI